MLLISPYLWVSAALLAAAGPKVACPAAEQTQDGRARTAITVVLSPRMPYALQEWRRMKNAAEGAGYRVVGLRDPRVPLSEWMDAVQASEDMELIQMPAIDEAQAATWGVLNHIPASVVSRCGKTHPWPILGVMPDAAWLEVLHSRSTQLGTALCC